MTNILNGFEIREGTFDDWKHIDRINRAVLPENYNENVYRSVLTSPTTICFVALKTEDVNNNEVKTDNADDKMKNEFEDDFEDELDENVEKVFESKTAADVVGYIISYLQFDQHKRLIAHVMSIGVLDEYRSKGLGKELIKRTEDVIRSKFQVVRSITLHVRKTNKRAINFYCKNGFMRVKKVKGYYGKEDGFLMKKNLDP